MVAQTPKITLKENRSWGRPESAFFVKDITNSIKFMVGNPVSEKEAQELINAGWIVKIVKER